jgi:hypothetical protein
MSLFKMSLLITVLSLTAFKVWSKPSWSASMQSLQKTLAELEPFLFNSKAFNDPSKQTFLKEKFESLAKESKNISHSPTLMDKDPTVRFVATQFAGDLARSSAAFNEGKTEFARYQAVKVTSSCIQCHTRMQQGPAFTFSKTESFFSLMPPAEQAEYLIASRRFDQAFQLLVKYFEDPEKEALSPWSLDKAAGLAMIIAVQYEQDIKKAEKISDLILKDKTKPLFLKEKAEQWKKSIAKWKAEKKKPANLADLSNLLKTKESEVDAMRVIPEVLKFLGKSRSASETGEALLLAGESYEMLNQISPMELHENYYESCIHNVPHTGVAKKCYKKLHNSVRVGYSGSRGTNIPVEVEVWLNKLKVLTE